MIFEQICPKLHTIHFSQYASIDIDRIDWVSFRLCCKKFTCDSFVYLQDNESEEMEGIKENTSFWHDELMSIFSRPNQFIRTFRVESQDYLSTETLIAMLKASQILSCLKIRSCPQVDLIVLQAFIDSLKPERIVELLDPWADLL